MKTFCICFVVLMALLAQTYAVGEVKDMESDSVELKPIVDFAETMLNNAVNSLFIHKIGTVLKAQKQIVSGVKYYLSVELRETTCIKNKPNDGVCDTTRTEICLVQVWSRPWLSDHKMQLVNFNCKAQ